MSQQTFIVVVSAAFFLGSIAGFFVAIFIYNVPVSKHLENAIAIRKKVEAQMVSCEVLAGTARGQLEFAKKVLGLALSFRKSATRMYLAAKAVLPYTPDDATAIAVNKALDEYRAANVDIDKWLRENKL